MRGTDVRVIQGKTQMSEKLYKEISKTAGGRFFLIGVFVLLLGIPLIMVETVVSGRSERFDNVSEEIARAWGKTQEITGPVLNVPVQIQYEVKEYSSEKKAYVSVTQTRTEYLAVLPSELNIGVTLEPEIRHQGIYSVLVYKAKARITGHFAQNDFKSAENHGKIQWNDITLNMGMDASAVRGDISMTFGNETLDLSPYTQWGSLEGVSAPVSIKKTMKEIPFFMSFSYNGSGETILKPVGKKSRFIVTSSWPHPVFRGAFRPDAPEITENGFRAEWNIPYIARGYSQTFVGINNLNGKAASVSLFNTMPVYKKALRLCGYGIMFIALTFMTMFVIELRIKKKFGEIQYIVVGLAVAAFFLTVLSLAEHLPFGIAYFLAAAVVTSMISLYVFGAQNDVKSAGICAVSTGVLYSLLYVMLSSADYALLIGTFILLCALGALMKVTVHLNGETKEPELLCEPAGKESETK